MSTTLKTSIVIPTCNGNDLLAECIAAIRTHTHTPYELIVVDNGSSDGTTAWCRTQKQLTLVSMPSNRGFPSACNAGLRLAVGDVLLLMNNDVVVGRNWLDNLLRALASRADIGMVGPMTNYVSGRQFREADYESMAQFQQAAESFNRSDPQRWSETKRLVGFCLAFKRELAERIGYLDERFSPGHYEDDDYCYRARRTGYRLLIAGDTIVHHHGSSSFRKLAPERIVKLIDSNWRKFMDKWGIDPRQYI
ncbi:glycosyltransferase family 2 protein [Paenibacillus cymbidii]|uniref:glycosyltransferase family 2 protein n=1 Tax=Paenibacillus cymbidii TaxID=1639034 RepID=UPI00108057EA|nr:glycosyltransferase family 2 protein [Paenibacillus cymbidii]